MPHSRDLPTRAFDTADVTVGDIVRYPAILRREHNGERSERLVVAEVDDVKGLRCLAKRDGEKLESWVVLVQLRENGVVVEGHVHA